MGLGSDANDKKKIQNCIEDMSLISGQMPVVTKFKKSIHRNDGRTVKFDNNAVVITDEKGEPMGTRIFGPVTRELRSKGQTKIMSLAPEVL